MAIRSFLAPPANDQRGIGHPRVVGGRLDVGAVEAENTPTSTKLVFIMPPTDVIAGQRVSPTIEVRVLDESGAVRTTDRSKVKLVVVSGPSKGKLLGSSSGKVNNGVVLFTKTSFQKAGVYVVAAVGGRNTIATSNPFTVSPGAPTKMLFTSVPKTTGTGQPFSMEVTLYDRYKNVATGDHSTLTLTLGRHPRGSLLSGMVTHAVVDGKALFSELRVTGVGSFSLKATSSVLRLVTSKTIKAFAMS